MIFVAEKALQQKYPPPSYQLTHTPNSFLQYPALAPMSSLLPACSHKQETHQPNLDNAKDAELSEDRRNPKKDHINI